MSELHKVLARGVRHPFGLTSSANLLNIALYTNIEGVGEYEEYLIDNFEPNPDCGIGVDIHKTDELYEDDVSIILIKSIFGKCYRFPKEEFSLVKSRLYEQNILRQTLPKHIIRSLYLKK